MQQMKFVRKISKTLGPKDKFFVNKFFATMQNIDTILHLSFSPSNTVNAPMLFPHRNLHDPNQRDDDMWHIYSQRYTHIFGELQSEVHR